VNAAPLKTCTKCDLPKGLDQFSKGRGRGGLQSWCKDCKADHYQKNKAEIAANGAAYYHENKAKIATYQRKRKSVDPIFKLTSNLRTRLGRAIERGQKSGSAVRDLGCTGPELRAHMESQFCAHPITGEAITWKNWSRTGWHIDHKKPLSLLQKDPTNRALFLELNCFKNLQPLWAEENMAKGDKCLQAPSNDSSTERRVAA